MSYLTAIFSRNLNFTSQSEKSEIILLRQSRCFHTSCNCKFQLWLKTPHKINFSHKLSLVGCLNSGCEHRGKEKVGKSNSGRSRARSCLDRAWLCLARARSYMTVFYRCLSTSSSQTHSKTSFSDIKCHTLRQEFRKI